VSTTIACLLYPGLTALDAVGPLQVMSGLERSDPEFSVVTVAATQGEAIASDAGVRLVASHQYADVPDPDVLVVPGGMVGTMRALTDPELLSYVRQAATSARWIASVCTGSLLLGAAGVLEGRRATSHWIFRHVLRELGAVPVAERWVRDGHVITSAGVSAGIDMAFDLVTRLSDRSAAVTISQMLEYDPQPPVRRSEWFVPSDDVNTARCRDLLLELMAPSPLRDRLTAS